MEREQLRTPADVAKRCQISAKTVLRAIHAGRLRASRLGESGAYRMRDEDIDAWIEQSVVTPLRRTPVRTPVARPLRALGEPTVGRLELTAEMGRHR
jgi:excisionase family DNA binding protein